jgi:cobalt-zinc-cadmium efflux system membrane fusion protein
MRYKKLLSVLFPIFSVLVTYSCGNHGKSDPPAERRFCIPDSLLKNVTFDTLHSVTVNSELSLSGKIAYNEDKVSRIYPLVSGHVTDVRASLGDFVEKGKILAVIESSDMANYYSEYRSSQADVAIARKNLEVTGNMRSNGISSEKDYLIAQKEYQKALSELNKISEVLKINGSSLSPNDSTGSGYYIKSPISGFVVQKNVTAGMDLRPDANDNLFTISDLKELWATANVYETDIAKIKIGSEADVVTLSYPGKKFKGKVERISNILDPETKVMSVKIRLDNKDLMLKPGMFAKITISLPEGQKMLSIKTSDLIFDDDKSYVLKYRGKCDVKIERVNVSGAVKELNFIECDSLKEGDLLISRNGLFIFTALKSL